MFVTPCLWSLVGFACMVVYGSFFEWALHRFVLHRVCFESEADVAVSHAVSKL